MILLTMAAFRVFCSNTRFSGRLQPTNYVNSLILQSVIETYVKVVGVPYRKSWHGVPEKVFPTHVGVYLVFRGATVARLRFPHACGGVPKVE